MLTALLLFFCCNRREILLMTESQTEKYIKGPSFISQICTGFFHSMKGTSNPDNSKDIKTKTKSYFKSKHQQRPHHAPLLYYSAVT
jgi:hypothetical protein